MKSSWGWSAYVESQGYKVLFDAGGDPSVLEYNARVLGVDLSRLSFAVLSHFHGDHYGGFKFIGRINPGLRVYVPPGGRTGILRGYGLKPVIVEKPMRVSDDMWIIGPFNNAGLSEQCFVFDAGEKGFIAILGCGHPGPDRMIEHVVGLLGRKMYMVIGGMHMPPRKVIDRVAALSEKVCPGHCSGEEARSYLARVYPDKYCDVYSGFVLEF